MARKVGGGAWTLMEGRALRKKGWSCHLLSVGQVR